MHLPSHRRAVTLAKLAGAARVARPACVLAIVLSLGTLVRAQQSSRQTATADLTPPQVNLEVREQNASRVLIAFRATDPNLEPASLKCLGWVESSDGSRVATAPSETRTTRVNGGIEGSMIWRSPRRES